MNVSRKYINHEYKSDSSMKQFDELILCLANEACQMRGLYKSNVEIISEWRIGKYVERSGHGQF
jgi:hypothetical protein